MIKMAIRKGDLVEVITGDDKGRQGKVMNVDIKKRRVLVEGINMIKRHQRPQGAASPGGIIEKPAFIDISNVVFVCPKCSKSSTIRRELRGGKKVRVCKSCGGEIES